MNIVILYVYSALVGFLQARFLCYCNFTRSHILMILAVLFGTNTSQSAMKVIETTLKMDPIYYANSVPLLSDLIWNRIAKQNFSPPLHFYAHIALYPVFLLIGSFLAYVYIFNTEVYHKYFGKAYKRQPE